MSSLPDIKKNFPDWYNEVIYQAELADQSPVRGAIVIRPYGFALWENIRDRMDHRIKETGHKNAAFPLFIPESFLKKEAEHVEGFAPELAVVTYAGGKKLEDPLVVRPTSETIIHYMFAQWIKSWRDLPLKINQWANVVRWEMRPRAFLRTTEFFWQEGHTAHATLEEADQEVLLMLGEYVDLAHHWLAIPVITGQKSEAEKFPGAIKTLTFEAFMPDGKALQMGTSHLLSQSFAHSFNMQFQDKDGELKYPYLTSWAITTRLVGAVVMMHGDEKGLRLPPKIAPIQVVIIPILKKGAEEEVIQAVHKLEEQLKQLGVRTYCDVEPSKSIGAKFFHWELKGVPIRIEIGPRDLEKNTGSLTTRLGEKSSIDLSNPAPVLDLLAKIQQALFDEALKKQQSMWKKAESFDEIATGLEEQASFYQTGWCLGKECEQELKKIKASIRCLLEKKEHTQCFFCKKPSVSDVIIAKSY